MAGREAARREPDYLDANEVGETLIEEMEELAQERLGVAKLSVEFFWGDEETCGYEVRSAVSHAPLRVEANFKSLMEAISGFMDWVDFGTDDDDDDDDEPEVEQ